jgi:hypothetical protein
MEPDALEYTPYITLDIEIEDCEEALLELNKRIKKFYSTAADLEYREDDRVLEELYCDRDWYTDRLVTLEAQKSGAIAAAAEAAELERLKSKPEWGMF